jgi:cytochrome P450
MISLASISEDLNPFPWYRTMRESQPVYFDRQRYTWSVFKFEDVQRVLSDYAAFSSQSRGGSQSDPNNPFAASMISADPPRHRKLRALVTQAFTPRAVERMAPRIAAIVDELLDQITPAGQMDVIQHLSYPLPVIVIAEMLGIPVSDRERFKHWSDIIVSSASTGGFAQHGNAIHEMSAYFTTMIEQCRRSPGDDLISGLLTANIDGEHLTMPELLGFCSLLLIAGNETTTNLIGNAILCFAEQNDLWERLRAEPALLPPAIEEVLRYRSPVQSMFRIVAADTTLGGQEIPKGSQVLAWIGSANRDPDQFAEAERFVIDRAPNRHIAFGHGIHYCLGAPLARMEANIALHAMLKRFKTLELVADAKLERQPSLIVYGVRALPITFSPA